MGWDGLVLIRLGRVMGVGVMKNGGWGGVKLGLGDCVWCVLLPKLVAIATIPSKSTPPVSHN